jgi:hypothetical protein
LLLSTSLTHHNACISNAAAMLLLLLGCFRLEHQSSDIQSVVSRCHESNTSVRFSSRHRHRNYSLPVYLSQIDSLLTKPLLNDSLR